MEPTAPKIDSRRFIEFITILKELMPNCTPELKLPDDDDHDAGAALLKIYSYLCEQIVTRLNQAPNRNFGAFLNMLGIKLLPASPARVPLTFKLAEAPEQGAVREILIPKGTQATADETEERPEALPFETEGDLLATFSTLSRVVSVEPFQDAIYERPPGFLETDIPKELSGKYQLLSFSKANSDSLQLDNVEGLETQDLLKVGQGELAGFFFIAEIKGTVVQLKEKLSRDYQVGTAVEKVVQFHLFESKNLQKHILYIGHPDLFNVKSPVVFTVNVKHLDGTAEGVDPLKMMWEYWGEKKDVEQDDWYPFEITSDTTEKLSRNGSIILVKPGEGEIKEYEINSVKSRWIRARLEEPLPVNINRKLPVLDHVTFQVKSSGDILLPELAYNNDTPLDFALKFLPFGSEPRLFDRFYLASQEIFSKKGAQITLDIHVDTRGILAAPVAIFDAEDNLLRVYARGTKGRLVEIRINSQTNTASVVDHGLPKTTTIALPDPEISTEATPAVIKQVDGNTKTLRIFVRGENGHLLEYAIIIVDGNLHRQEWIDHGIPVDKFKVDYDPAAVLHLNNQPMVFVVGENGGLFQYKPVNPPSVFNWTDLGKPPETDLNASPFAITYNGSNDTLDILKVFVKGTNSKLYEWTQNEITPWKLYDPGVKIDLKPFAQIYSNYKIQLNSPTCSSVDDAYRNIEIEIENVGICNIRSYNGTDKSAIIDTDIDNNPNFTIKTGIVNTTGGVKEATSNTITFEEDSGVLRNDGVYDNLQITIHDQNNIFPDETTTIVAYTGKDRTAVVDPEWKHIPNDKYNFTIEDLTGDIKIDDTEETAFAKVFVKVKSESTEMPDSLWSLDTFALLPETERWKSLGVPDDRDGIGVSSSPYGYLEKPGSDIFTARMFIFVRGTDNLLWERTDVKWVSHGPLQSIELRNSPYVTKTTINPGTNEEYTRLTVFSGSNKNSILVKNINFLMRLEGLAQVGTERTVTLSNPPSEILPGMEIEIVDGKGAGQTKNIGDFEKQYDMIVLSQGETWEESGGTRTLDSTSEYKINESIHTSQVTSSTMSTIQLVATASQKPNAYKDFEIQISDDPAGTHPGNIRITEYDKNSRIAIVNKPWNKAHIPSAGTSYTILTERQNKSARAVKAACVDFDQDDPEFPNKSRLFIGRKIKIIPDGPSQIIVRYDEAERNAFVKDNWHSIPDNNPEFEVVAYEGEIVSASNPTALLGAEAEDLVDPSGLQITIDNAGTYTINAFNDGTATMHRSWIADPDQNASYQIDPDAAGNIVSIEEGGNNTVKLTLDEQAINQYKIYNGFMIRIYGKDGSEIYKIENYENYTVEIFLTEPLPDPPDNQPLAYKIEPLEGNIVAYTNGPEVKFKADVPLAVDLFSGLLIKILSGNGRNQIRKIIAYDKNSRTATVDAIWEPLPEPDSQYGIDIAFPGIPQGVRSRSIRLAVHALEEEEIYQNLAIEVTDEDGNRQLNKIIHYTGGEDRKATVKDSWNPQLSKITSYRIITSGTIATAYNAHILLDPLASTNSGVYEGLEIEVAGYYPNPGYVSTPRIIDYDGVLQKAMIASNWDPENLPSHDATFSIGHHVAKAQGGTYAFVTVPDSDPPLDIHPEEDEIEIRLIRDDEKIHIKRIVKSVTKKEGHLLLIVNEAWTLGEEPGSNYTAKLIKKGIISGMAMIGTSRTITLANHHINSDTLRHVLNRELKLIRGPGSEPGSPNSETREIIQYNIPYQVATLDRVWDRGSFPGSASVYALLAGAVGDEWDEYIDSVEVNITPELSWEYWNGNGWVGFKTGEKGEHKFVDNTKNFLIDGTIKFIVPQDIDLTDVSGQENIWIRARIIGSDYGKETYKLREVVAETEDGSIKETTLEPSKTSIQPPLIVDLKIYYVLQESKYPRQCITFNNLQFIDQTDANKTDKKRFKPFEMLEDRDKTLYLGFSSMFKDGPIKIFFAAKELSFVEAEKPKMVWSYRGEENWKRLSTDDATESLVKPEVLTLQGEKDFSVLSLFGSEQFWIRGALEEGWYNEMPVLSGIYPNTTWVFQAETIRDEILGSSDGEANQIFQFFKYPVLKDNEKLQVAEVLTKEEQDQIRASFDEEALVEERNEDGEVIKTWVMWKAVKGFYNSTTGDRHYILDHATGEVCFGNGINGRIPPTGIDNIRATIYQAVVGGEQGNVKRAEIQTLVTAIDGVDAVINPTDAGGGANTATLTQMYRVGPTQISHRNRAVTVEDFEWLAREASREVVKVRCLANVNSRGEKETGWVTLYIVPNLPEQETPQPSFELRRKVQRYLEERCANAVADLRHIHVSGPVYHPVSIAVDIFVDSIEKVGRVEREARTKLSGFFHPLTGGSSGDGWEFGRNVYVSDVYALLEDINGVDHVENLDFENNGIGIEEVEVGPDQLMASGKHTINIKIK